MAEIPAKWLMRRYLVLRSVFQNKKKFSFKEAQETLQDDSRIVNLCLSELRKFGWLESESDPKDGRKKLYYLKDLGKVYDEITKEMIRGKNGQI